MSYNMLRMAIWWSFRFTLNVTFDLTRVANEVFTLLSNCKSIFIPRDAVI